MLEISYCTSIHGCVPSLDRVLIEGHLRAIHRSYSARKCRRASVSRQTASARATSPDAPATRATRTACKPAGGRRTRRSMHHLAVRHGKKEVAAPLSAVTLHSSM
jgi:hypothetical protein